MSVVQCSDNLAVVGVGIDVESGAGDLYLHIIAVDIEWVVLVLAYLKEALALQCYAAFAAGELARIAQAAVRIEVYP